MLSGNNGSKADNRMRRLAWILARLEGTDGKAKARGANREALLRELDNQSHLPVVAGFKAEQLLEERFDRKQREGRAAHRSDQRDGPLSTTAGLDAGQQNPDGFRFEYHRRWPTANWRVTIPRQAPAFETSKVGILEDHPVLDLRELKLRGRMQGAETWSHSLRWSAVPDEFQPILLIADFRDPSAPFLVLDLGREGAPSFRRQLIPLVATNPKAKAPRWYLECPVTRERSDYLVLRNGVFASAGAHRLVYRSQRS